jgi:eukaryotic-like serine/threonine-protein kinase
MTEPVSKREPQPRELRAHCGRVYTLVERIGSGATGTVYRALDGRLELPREVCIKRLSAEVDPELAMGLREEARLLASVRHANVVSLLGVGEEESGSPFLVLELVSGPDLRELSRGLLGAIDGPGSLPWRLAVHVACALLRALGAVQRALPGLVHRDVTPHNVLVSTEGEVKLADFGIALTRERATWPSTGMVRGKVGYMAPEQIRGESLDVRTDLFAVGVVLYELLAGHRPAKARTVTAELHAAESGVIEPLERRRPDLAPHLIAVIGRLLAKRPSDRHAGPDDALRELAPYGAGELGSLRMADLVRRLHASSKERAAIAESGPRVALVEKSRGARRRDTARFGGRSR